MVWKRIVVFCLVLAVLSPLAISASAYSVYNEGNISTTYLAYFEDISSKIGVHEDYVFFRSGQNEYTMAVGDFDLVNGYFISPSVKIYQIYSTSTSGYNSYYSFSSRNETGFSLQVASGLVYSNLGNYPDLIERSNYNETAILFVMCISLFMSIASAVFCFGKRSYR